MSLEAWGDEGDVMTEGEEMAYEEGRKGQIEDTTDLIDKEINMLQTDLDTVNKELKAVETSVLWEAYTRLNQGLQSLKKIKDSINGVIR